jgi:hypothetical protein
MLVRGAFVVKLPAPRVTELVGSEDGIRFDPRKSGAGLRERLVLSPKMELEWEKIAEEALAFVRNQR